MARQKSCNAGSHQSPGRKLLSRQPAVAREKAVGQAASRSSGGHWVCCARMMQLHQRVLQLVRRPGQSTRQLVAVTQAHDSTTTTRQATRKQASIIRHTHAWGSQDARPLHYMSGAGALA